MNAHWVLGYGAADAHRDGILRTTTNTFGYQTGRCLAVYGRHRAALAEIERQHTLERAGIGRPRGGHWTDVLRVVPYTLALALVLAAVLIG